MDQNSISRLDQKANDALDRVEGCKDDDSQFPSSGSFDEFPDFEHGPEDHDEY